MNLVTFVGGVRNTQGWFFVVAFVGNDSSSLMSSPMALANPKRRQNRDKFLEKIGIHLDGHG